MVLQGYFSIPDPVKTRIPRVPSVRPQPPPSQRRSPMSDTEKGSQGNPLSVKAWTATPE